MFLSSRGESSGSISPRKAWNAAGLDEQVAGLDVAMDDARLMRTLETQSRLANDVDSLVESAFSMAASKIGSLIVLKGKEPLSDFRSDWISLNSPATATLTTPNGTGPADNPWIQAKPAR